MILDTNAVSDLLEGNERLADLLAPDVRHHLPIMVLGEYRFGLLGSRRGVRLEPLIDQLESESGYADTGKRHLDRFPFNSAQTADCKPGRSL